MNRKERRKIKRHIKKLGDKVINYIFNCPGCDERNEVSKDVFKKEKTFPVICKRCEFKFMVRDL